jgi:hypothetical protein
VAFGDRLVESPSRREIHVGLLEGLREDSQAVLRGGQLGFFEGTLLVRGEQPAHAPISLTAWASRAGSDFGDAPQPAHTRATSAPRTEAGR